MTNDKIQMSASRTGKEFPKSKAAKRDLQKVAKHAKGEGSSLRSLRASVDFQAKPELPAHLSTAVEVKPLIQFRPYQLEPFLNRENGIEVWCWSRQIGKSYTLAAWAVDRLLTRPGRLVTILSNSQANGQELNLKVAEVCQKLGQAYEQLDLSADANFESMKLETQVTVNGEKGRIRVLAASARTARGFSGDLILDEFAFHENSQAIWEAAEPIISSNKDFLCRIASTPNGKYNMFYRLANDPHVVLRRVPRSLAYQQGLKIYDPQTRAEITPEEARSRAHDKAAYDQNYECVFADESSALLTYELISQAEMPAERCGAICRGEWSAAAFDWMRRAIGPLFIGMDVGRERDLTTIAVIEKLENLYWLRALLELERTPFPRQRDLLGQAMAAAHFRKAAMDQTGMGAGLLEFSQEKFGRTKIEGINFAASAPISARMALAGKKQETAPVTEVMASEMLEQFVDRRMRIPLDQDLREDLRKPERIVAPSGRVSIAATRDETGHADRFWSLALALYAARGRGGEFYSSVHSGGDASGGSYADVATARIPRGERVLV